VETTPTETGPVVDAQTAALPVPEIDQFITPLGATAFAVPVTVAVKTTEPPSAGTLEEAFAIVGAALATVVEDPELVEATGL